jgi:hypothetical protein
MFGADSRPKPFSMKRFLGGLGALCSLDFLLKFMVIAINLQCSFVQANSIVVSSNAVVPIGFRYPISYLFVDSASAVMVYG